MILTKFLVFLAVILAIIFIVFFSVTGYENPRFDSKQSDNFKNIVYYQGTYEDKEIKISPDFKTIEKENVKYIKDTTFSYKGSKDYLILKKHPFYYIDNSILKSNVKNNHNIPKIIWQTLKESPTEGTYIYDCTKSFKSQDKWDYRFLNDEDAISFLKENFDEDVVHAFEVLIPGAFKADLLRACLLYIHGGVYADIKLKLHYDLDSFLYDDLVLVNEFKGMEGIWNGFMASVPKHIYFKKVINNIAENVKNMYYGFHCLDITGPRLCGKVYKELNFEKDYIKLNARKLKGDIKSYINLYNNQEIFLSNKLHNKYRKEYKSKSDYASLWENRKVFDMEKHQKYFGSNLIIN